MKIRKGFVSNSSTSSFLIIGIESNDFGLAEKYDLDCYEGYEEGDVIGVSAEPYLRKYNLPDSIEKVRQDLEKEMSKEDWEQIKDENFRLIYDACEG